MIWLCIILILAVSSSAVIIDRDFLRVSLHNKIQISMIAIYSVVLIMISLIYSWFLDAILSNEIIKKASFTTNHLSVYIIYVVLICIYLPLFEELLYRYRIKKLIKTETAYLIIESILFSISHFLLDLFNRNIIYVLSLFPYYLIMGYLLGKIYLKSNNIWVPIFIHIFLNIAIYILPFILRSFY